MLYMVLGTKEQIKGFHGLCPLAAHPGKADAGDGVAEHVRHDGRVRVGGGEVSVEPGRVPVRHLGTI
jgi:hypothetical protein